MTEQNVTSSVPADMPELAMAGDEGGILTVNPDWCDWYESTYGTDTGSGYIKGRVIIDQVLTAAAVVDKHYAANPKLKVTDLAGGKGVAVKVYPDDAQLGDNDGTNAEVVIDQHAIDKRIVTPEGEARLAAREQLLSSKHLDDQESRSAFKGLARPPVKSLLLPVQWEDKDVPAEYLEQVYEMTRNSEWVPAYVVRTEEERTQVALQFNANLHVIVNPESTFFGKASLFTIPLSGELPEVK